MVMYNYRTYGNSDVKTSKNFWQRVFGYLNNEQACRDVESVLK